MFVYAFTGRTASHLSHTIYVLDPKQVAITSKDIENSVAKVDEKTASKNNSVPTLTYS